MRCCCLLLACPRADSRAESIRADPNRCLCGDLVRGRAGSSRKQGLAFGAGDLVSPCSRFVRDIRSEVRGSC